MMRMKGVTWKPSDVEAKLYILPGSPWKKKRVPSNASIRGSPLEDAGEGTAGATVVTVPQKIL